MLMNKLKTLSTVDLVNLLSTIDEYELNDDDSQAEKNAIIYELTCRVYVPFMGVSFDELLLENGYKPIEPKKNKTKIK